MKGRGKKSFLGVGTSVGVGGWAQEKGNEGEYGGFCIHI
jgi:hypothetical protein